MKEYQTRTLNIFILSTVLLTHGVVGLLDPVALLSFKETISDKPPQKLSIKLKNRKKVRRIGVEDSKLTKLSSRSKQESKNLFKQFTINGNQGTDSVKVSQSSYSKKVLPTPKEKRAKRLRRINYTQQQIMQEAINKQTDEGRNLKGLNYNISFKPPKGISEDELNEFEKVFYSFFSRAAVQYIKTLNQAYTQTIDEKPYLKETFQKHKPETLTAMVRYDRDGNAQLVKILKSSYDDDIHNFFESALLKMDKIQNITEQLLDEDGTYTAFFLLSINEPR